MIRIAASARRDLDEGFAFYESQELGLGDYFLSSVKAEAAQSFAFPHFLISLAMNHQCGLGPGWLTMLKAGSQQMKLESQLQNASTQAMGISLCVLCDLCG
jgi:hypothetical protein